MPFFFLFLFASLVLGTFTVGPFSIRVYFTVAMAVYLFLFRKKDRHDSTRISYKILGAVTIYLLLAALSLTMCGELVTSGFPKSLLSLFFNCYVAFFAFNHFVKTTKQLKATVIFLISVMVFDCLVSVLQYQGNPLGLGIALGLINDPEVQSEVFDRSAGGVAAMGEIRTIGVFIYSFVNGNYIALVGLMLLGLWESAKERKVKLICLCLYALFVFASLITQSRTPFILLLLCSIFIVTKGLKRKAGILIVAGFIIMLAVVIPFVLESVDFGRLFNPDNYENDPRQKIWDYCFEFIGNNLMWGGPVSFEKIYDKAPHNYFLGAFISSGLLGGLMATYIYVRILHKSLPLFLGKHSMLVSSLAGAVLIYSAGSLFHNASVISGDTMFYIVYCLMLKSQILEKNNCLV